MLAMFQTYLYKDVDLADMELPSNSEQLLDCVKQFSLPSLDSLTIQGGHGLDGKVMALSRTSLRKVRAVKLSGMKFSPDLLLSEFIDSLRANKVVSFENCTFSGNFFSV